MMFAKSLAGHDRNHYYLVVQEEDNYVYLVNGTTRPLDKPKKKKKMHIQIIKRIPEEVAAILDQKELDQNQLVRQSIETMNMIYNKNKVNDRI